MEQTIHEEAITAGKRPFGFVQPCIAICASYIFNRLIDVGRQRDALAMTVYKDGKDKSETQRGAGHQAGAFFVSKFGGRPVEGGGEKVSVVTL